MADAPRYLILEPDGQPLDGEIVDEAGLYRKLRFADHDARVLVVQGANSTDAVAFFLVDVTAEAVAEWYMNRGGRAIAWECVSTGGGTPGLLERFYPAAMNSLRKRAGVA